MLKIPLDKLDQGTQEEMLIAAASGNGDTLLELVEGAQSEPFDRDIIMNALTDKTVSPRAKEAIQLLIKASLETKAHMEAALAVQAAQLSEVGGHGKVGSKN